jgi:hypothetical protein
VAAYLRRSLFDQELEIADVNSYASTISGARKFPMMRPMIHLRL